MVQKIGKHGLEVRSGQIAGALEQRLDDLLLGREVRAENMRRGGRDRDDHAPVAAQALPPEARALTQCLGRFVSRREISAQSLLLYREGIQSHVSVPHVL